MPANWRTEACRNAWQIAPRVLGEMPQDEDPEKSPRVMRAILQMNKIDLGALGEAYEEV